MREFVSWPTGQVADQMNLFVGEWGKPVGSGEYEVLLHLFRQRSL